MTHFTDTNMSPGLNGLKEFYYCCPIQAFVSRPFHYCGPCSSNTPLLHCLPDKLTSPWTKWLPFHRRHVQMLFLNENIWISNKISLKYVPSGPIDNMLELVHIMAWRCPVDRPSSEPMLTKFTDAYIAALRGRWVNSHGDVAAISKVWFSVVILEY